MGFQKGDQVILIQNKPFTLRLTLGALAEISERLNVTGPDALLNKLTVLDAPKTRLILACLTHPRLKSDVLMSDNDIAKALPKICEVFEYAFG